MSMIYIKNRNVKNFRRYFSTLVRCKRATQNNIPLNLISNKKRQANYLVFSINVNIHIRTAMSMRHAARVAYYGFNILSQTMDTEPINRSNTKPLINRVVKGSLDTEAEFAIQQYAAFWIHLSHHKSPASHYYDSYIASSKNSVLTYVNVEVDFRVVKHGLDS